MTCLDFSKTMIAKARENVRNVKSLDKQFSFVQENIVHDNFPPGHFDAVTIISVLHYLLPYDIETVLEKSYTALRKGGKVIIIEYWANKHLTKTEKFALQIASKNRTRQGVQTYFLKEDRYRQLMENIGFKDVIINTVSERIFLAKYFKMNRKVIPRSSKNEKIIRVTIFEATKPGSTS